MSRSSKKGPFVDAKLAEKVQKMALAGEKKPIKTWSRTCTITPTFDVHTFMVYNGRKFLPVYVSDILVVNKLGAVSFTRLFKGHGQSHTKEATALT